MTLLELSAQYRHSEELLRQRIAWLRQERQKQTDPEAARRLTQRIAALDPLLREARDLAILTQCYYERGYHKNEAYTL